MANEVNLIDCVEELTQKQIVMRGDVCVYFDTKKDVEKSIIDEAKKLKESKDLELIRNEKTIDIKNKFTEQEKENVLIDDVLYQGGYDSAIKLDSAKRLSESAGFETVTFYDADNIGHDLSIDDANLIVIRVAGKYQDDFKKYQSLKVEIKNAKTKEEIEAIKW